MGFFRQDNDLGRRLRKIAYAADGQLILDEFFKASPDNSFLAYQHMEKEEEPTLNFHYHLYHSKVLIILTRFTWHTHVAAIKDRLIFYQLSFVPGASSPQPTMPSTSFDKTRKAIAKKKGPIESLHQYSRDSKRLHRAQVRDEKLQKIAASRRRNDQPYRTHQLSFMSTSSYSSPTAN